MALMSAAAVLALGSTPTLAGSKGGANPGVLAPQSHPYGKTYGEWTAEWLGFLYSIPFDENPLFTRDPTAAVVGQSGPVSFIVAGGDGGEVTITIPVGQALFFPMVLFTTGICPESPDPNFPEVAAFVIDTVTELTVEIDGVSLKNPFQYRASSGVLSDLAFDPSFEALLAPCGTDAGEHQDIVDGYWLMLAPLSKGQHTVHVAATLGPPINFSGEATDHIIVE